MQLGEKALAKPLCPQIGLVVVFPEKPQRLELGNLSRLVEFALLSGVLAEAAQGLRCIGEVAPFKQPKPHLLIDELLVAEIKPAGGVAPPKEHRRGLANQIAGPIQALGNHLRSEERRVGKEGRSRWSP